MRFSIRKTIFLIGISAILVVLILFARYAILWNYEDYLFRSYEEGDFRRSDQLVKKNIHYSNYEFTHEQKLKRQLHSQALEAKSMTEKCAWFFNFIDKAEPEKSFHIFENRNYDKGITDKRNFVEGKLDSLRKERNNDPHAIERKDNISINVEFNQAVRDTFSIEQEMADLTTIYRIFGKCFEREAFDLNDEKQANLRERYTEKLFPFLTGEPPDFQRLNETTINKGYPVIHGGGKFDEISYEGENILDFMKKKKNGKGIVLTGVSRHSKDLVKLIRVLRALGNELPIEIVHKGDFSKRNQHYLVQAATTERDVLLDPKDIRSQDKNSFEAQLINKASTRNYSFPKQELWFVNIQNSIQNTNRRSFPGYVNKVFALLLSSFEEVLMLDVDTVPLVNPNEFFNSQQYQKSGTFFFRDRSLKDFNNYIEVNYFAKLFPFRNDSIETIFGINPITDFTLKNTYIGGYRHFQEAGVVAFNKERHFRGLLMLPPLIYWKEPVQSSIWGDKEIYWLCLSLAGDEDYQFNNYTAASIGNKVSESKDKFYPDSEGRELCSSHPGHYGDNGKLMWINSGFNYCKKNMPGKDKAYFPFSNHDLPELHDLYHNPLRIKVGVVPPPLPILRELCGTSEEQWEVNDMWKNKSKDVDDLDGEERDKNQFLTNRNPQKGWIRTPICTDYQYCACEVIDGFYLQDVLKGQFFESTEDESELYTFLGDLWSSGNVRDLRDLP